MKKKNFLMLPCIAAVAIATFVGKKTFESHAYESHALLAQNIEALALDGEAPPSVKRLKQVNCECTNGAKGTTLKCSPDGDLELCTPTQQGSNACYRLTLGGLKLCTD